MLKKIIYRKIFILPYDGVSFNNSRDNLLIILLELDKLSLIEYGLIEFLYSFSVFDCKNSDYKGVMRHFNNLVVMLRIFNSIILLPILRKFIINIPILIDEYTAEIEMYNASDEVQRGVLKPEYHIEEKVEIKVAMNDMKRILQSSSVEINDEIVRLRNYLCRKTGAMRIWYL